MHNTRDTAATPQALNLCRSRRAGLRLARFRQKNICYSEPTSLGRFNGNRGKLTHDLFIVGVLAVFCVKPASFTPPAPFLMKREETVWTKVAFKSGVLGLWPPANASKCRRLRFLGFMMVLEYRYGRVELCRSWTCAARSQLSGTLRSEGGSGKSVSAEREAGEKGPEENPAWSFLSPCRLPLILQSPSHLSLFIASYLPPGPFAPCALSSSCTCV